MAEFIFTPDTVRDPRNHPRRIYISCHPEDMKYFDTIAEQIRQIEPDCVIAFASADGDEALRLEELVEFHLTVALVTENWFSEGAHKREFDHLVASYKPILPILFKGSLEEPFNETTDNLQFLQINDSDFSEKMRRTLQDILFDSALLDKVRSVFTHKMFIAYCREDRERVARLIRSIHGVKGGKRVAVWYDKYLPFGKNFEDSIFNELDECDIFGVTLTQNLLNRDNYVKEYEYPRALKGDKNFIFFEFDSADKNIIFDERGCPDKYCSAAFDDDTAFSNVLGNLIKKTPGKKVQLDSVETDYLLALAYQNGLFVEFDHNYAVQRFRNAANANNADAARNLGNMYYRGIGIARDVEKAIKWYEKEVSITNRLFREEGERLRKLKGMPISVLHPSSNEFEPNKRLWNDVEPIIHRTCSLASDLYSRCVRNARILRDEGRYNGAMRLYRTILDALDWIDSFANRLELGAHFRSSVENEMNRLNLVYSDVDVDKYKKAWCECLKKYNNDPKSYINIFELVNSAHNYSKTLIYKTERLSEGRNQVLGEARKIILKVLQVLKNEFDNPEIRDDRSIRELEPLLHRDVGVAYIEENPTSDEERIANGKEALQRFEIMGELLDNLPFDIEENPYLYTLKPWGLYYTGCAFEYIGKYDDANEFYMQSLEEMMKAERVLGDRKTSEEFPIIMLQFYSVCIYNLAHSKQIIEDKLELHRFSLFAIGKSLLDRYSNWKFKGVHSSESKRHLERLKNALEFLKVNNN